MGWAWFVAYLAGGFVALVALFLFAMYLVGRSLSLEHRHTCRVRIAQPIEAVYERIADVQGWATWDDGVNRVEAENAAAPGADFSGRMYMGRNTMGVRVRRTAPPKRLEIEVEDLGAKIFSGVWRYELSSDGGKATSVVLTEDGQIHAAIPRAFARKLADPMLYMKRHLKVLAKSFGEDGAVSQ